jgi:hypothetical protein
VFDPSVDGLEWRPYLRRPMLEELEAIEALPRVAELLRAFELARLQRRWAASSRKVSPGQKLRLVDGDRLKLEGHGPDYRGPRLL